MLIHNSRLTQYVLPGLHCCFYQGDARNPQDYPLDLGASRDLVEVSHHGAMCSVVIEGWRNSNIYKEEWKHMCAASL